MERYKVGDKVLVEGRGTARPRTVIEITKAGNIRVEGEKGLFNPNGFLRGASEWSVTYLRLISDEQYVAQLQKYELKKECEGIVKYLSQLNELPAENVRQAIKELYTTIKEQ